MVHLSIRAGKADILVIYRRHSLMVLRRVLADHAQVVSVLLFGLLLLLRVSFLESLLRGLLVLKHVVRQRRVAEVGGDMSRGHNMIRNLRRAFSKIRLRLVSFCFLTNTLVLTVFELEFGVKLAGSFGNWI
jgi:hypothetical protein